ncbi:MAG: response regulator transcription factor [Dehalococcoidia bacterium]
MKLVIVDHHELVRAGLVGLFRQHSEFTVVGEGATCEDGLTAVRAGEPDIVLVDLQMTGCDVVAFIHSVLEAAPRAKIVILSNEIDNDALFRVIVGGASGFVPKSTDFPSLVQSLRWVAAGEVALSRKLTTHLATRLQQMADQASSAIGLAEPRVPPAIYGRLSQRERLVLALLARGAANKEIARSLHISQHTVRTHVTNVLEKLELVNRVQAAAFAVQHGLTEVEGETTADE